MWHEALDVPVDRRPEASGIHRWGKVKGAVEDVKNAVKDAGRAIKDAAK